LSCIFFKWWKLEAFQAYGNACIHDVMCVNTNLKHLRMSDTLPEEIIIFDPWPDLSQILLDFDV